MKRFRVKQEYVLQDDPSRTLEHWIDAYRADEVDTRIQELVKEVKRLNGVITECIKGFRDITNRLSGKSTF